MHFHSLDCRLPRSIVYCLNVSAVWLQTIGSTSGGLRGTFGEKSASAGPPVQAQSSETTSSLLQGTASILSGGSAAPPPTPGAASAKCGGSVQWPVIESVIVVSFVDYGFRQMSVSQ